MKAVILYYSKTGTTEKIADRIAAKFVAKKIPVHPDKEFGNFVSSVARVGTEKLTKKNTANKTKPTDLSRYDVVFVGFPVWYGSMPPFMQEYIKTCKLDGKTIIPFITAAANGKESSMKTIKELCPNSTVEEGFYASKLKKADDAAWVETLYQKYQQ